MSLLRPDRLSTRDALIAVAGLLGLMMPLAWAVPSTAGTITIQYQITGGTIGGVPYTGGGNFPVRHTATAPGSFGFGDLTLLTLSVTAPSVPGTQVLGVPRFGWGVVANPYKSLSIVSETYQPYPRYRRIKYYSAYAHWTAHYGLSGTDTLRIGKRFHTRVESILLLHTTMSADYTMPNTLSTFIPVTHANFTGHEVQTTYVPEPNTLPLVASGLLLAAVVAAKRRLRRC